MTIENEEVPQRMGEGKKRGRETGNGKEEHLSAR
jgi:hypothetical protein